MWVIRGTMYCPYLWQLIQNWAQSLVFSWLCHLHQPQYTSHPCNYFIGFSVALQLLVPNIPGFPFAIKVYSQRHTIQSCQQFPLTTALSLNITSQHPAFPYSHTETIMFGSDLLCHCSTTTLQGANITKITWPHFAHCSISHPPQKYTLFRQNLVLRATWEFWYCNHWIDWRRLIAFRDLLACFLITVNFLLSVKSSLHSPDTILELSAQMTFKFSGKVICDTFKVRYDDKIGRLCWKCIRSTFPPCFLGIFNITGCYIKISQLFLQ